jgi:hypothetical protein
MIFLGVALLVIGFIAAVPMVWSIGVGHRPGLHDLGHWVPNEAAVLIGLVNSPNAEDQFAAKRMNQITPAKHKHGAMVKTTRRRYQRWA